MSKSGPGPVGFPFLFRLPHPLKPGSLTAHSQVWVSLNPMEETRAAKAADTSDRALFVTDEEDLVCTPARYILMALGWFNVALGVIGLFLPLMPTTVFLLIALWFFSKSSVRFQRWLYDHPKLGSTLRAWHAHRAIPTSAKFAAVIMMCASWAIVALFVADGWLLPLGLALVLAPIAAFITSRPAVPA